MKQDETNEAKIEQLVFALLACPRIEDAAKSCRMSRATVWRLSQSPDFQKRMTEARTQLMSNVVTTLQANTLVFSQSCDDGSEPPAPTGGLSAAKKKTARRRRRF